MLPASKVFTRTRSMLKAKYSGMDLSEAEKVKHLWDGSARLRNFSRRSQIGRGCAAVGHKKKSVYSRLEHALQPREVLTAPTRTFPFTCERRDCRHPKNPRA